MKKISYLDILKSLLPKNEWESFFEYYNKALVKNFTLLTHKGLKKTELHKYIDGLSRPGQHFLHQGGFFYIQEEAASLPAQILLKENSENKTYNHKPLIILDMCAAPGGKSIQLADTLINSAFIICNEPIDARRKALIYNINRTGCYNTMINNYDGKKIGKVFPETFDKVLIDAPCSGEGMNYKNTIQESWDEKKIKKLADTQYQLLKSGILACKTGGTIIYATCTLNPIENEGVISAIIKEFSGKIELENIDIPNKSTGIDMRRGEKIIDKNSASKLARFRPHLHYIGGFFIAKIKKKQSILNNIENKEKFSEIIKNKEKREFTISSDFQSEVRKILKENFGIEKNNKYFFIGTKKNIFITSPVYQNLPISIKNNIQKIGIPIYEIGQKGRIPTHHLGNILGHLATKNFLILTDEQAQKYTEHKDLQITHFTNSSLKEIKNNIIILKRKNYGFSIGKIIDEKIKNKMI